MLRYPLYCPPRRVLQSDLEELIRYHLCDLQDGYVDIDDEDLCDALEDDRRVADAVQIVKSWGWDFKRGRRLDRRCWPGPHCKGIRGHRLASMGFVKAEMPRPHAVSVTGYLYNVCSVFPRFGGILC